MLQLDLFYNYKKLTDEINTEQSKSEFNEYILGYADKTIRSGKYDIPLLKPYDGIIPENFITISEAKYSTDNATGVACFDDDKVLLRLLKNPDKYIQYLRNHPCTAEPDFSLKSKDPLSCQIMSIFSAHILASYMENHGIQIIPTMMWSDKRSYEFCFDGHSRGGIVMVSTIGTLRDERSRMYFKDGFLEMLKRISPEAVILYGDINDMIMSWMPKGLDIHHVNHNRFNRARRNG